MTDIATIDAFTTRVHPDAPPWTARALTPPRRLLVNVCWMCVIAAVVLSLLGILAIATTKPGFALRQAAFLPIGLLAAAIVAVPHYDWIRRLSYPLLAVVIGLLVFVMIPAVPEAIVRPYSGARRWINLGIIDFQPSELAKIAFVLALANYLRFRRNYRRFRGLLIPFVLTLVPMGLIVIEPDLGTSLLFLPTLFAMLVAAGAKLSHIALIIILGVSSAPLMYPILRPHQKDRIQAMIGQLTGDDRHLDDSGFQGDRAMTLVAAGQFAGVGKDKARNLVIHNALPEEENDMIFAVVTNRWGLVGGVAVIGAYVLFMLGGVLTAGYCRDAFGRLVAIGFVAAIFTQMTINIGMTIGLFPITGMTLPFVSYGGSSLVTNWLMIGLLFNVAMRRRRFLEREPFVFEDEEDDL